MKHDAVMLMGRIHELTQKWLRRELASAGLPGVAPSHGDVLALLFMKGEATMHELAAFAHRTKATTTVLVDKLEAMDLVRRATSVYDARTKVVVLTKRGEALKEDFERISNKLVSMVYAPIGKTGGERLEQ
ncbi:MAG: MarR family transcriptional regulator, partial [Kiritimatiellae bacterium]|nr:MarR family transcriptional regulator [Kiritimatiellia bacterium]